ncbi:hypothetical protein BKA93DRAFT_829710 [Sparassis latifolia]
MFEFTGASAMLFLPRELAERILIFCHPRDVSNFAQTCRGAHNLVYKSKDQYLWRELFLELPFDDLRKAVLPFGAKKVDFDWKMELQRRIEAEKVAQSAIEGPAFTRALQTFMSVIETALPATATPGTDSTNLLWLDGVLQKCAFHYFLVPSSERQLHGRLRAYLALWHENGDTDESRRRLNVLRRTSRCYVYDLRKYEEETLWGPYVVGEKGIKVNWEHMEHIVTVVAMKLRELPLLALQIYGYPVPGLGGLRAYSAPHSFSRKAHDWAGVSGVWRRFVCFMDYRDLFAFNFSSSRNGARDPSFFGENYQEAIRPVELHLEVVDPEDGADAETITDYPPLFFKGFSRGSHSGEAAVEGSVRFLSDGCIRWFFVTKYDGLTQWSAEGVQLGNVCSMAGVAGIWTGAFHEEADPAGPFWMWKAHSALPFYHN